MIWLNPGPVKLKLRLKTVFNSRNFCKTQTLTNQDPRHCCPTWDSLPQVNRPKTFAFKVESIGIEVASSALLPECCADSRSCR
jgi:hypothetical protein